jgi:hypothetical protein
MRLDSGAALFRGHHYRGDRAGLSTVTFPEHPSARTMTRGPVRTSGLLRRCDSAPRGASRPFLECSAKMPRNRFYNRRSRHEHSPGAPSPETARRALWETRQRSTSRPSSPGRFRRWSRTAPDHLAVIQPPAAPRFDGAAPASGRSASTRALAGWGGRAPRLCRPTAIRRFEPSDTSLSAAGGGAQCAPRPCRVSSIPPGHVNAAGDSRSSR